VTQQCERRIGAPITHSVFNEFSRHWAIADEVIGIRLLDSGNDRAANFLRELIIFFFYP